MPDRSTEIAATPAPNHQPTDPTGRARRPWWGFWRKRNDGPPAHAPDCIDGSKCGAVEHCPPPWPHHQYRPMVVMENYWAECSCGWAASDCHPAEFRAERDWQQHIDGGGLVDQRIVGWKHGYPVVEATSSRQEVPHA